MAFPYEEFIEYLRMSVMDDPETNELLLDYEFPEKNIKFALLRTINRINMTPPIFTTSYKLDDFAYGENYITLIPGVLGYIYQGKAAQEKRNEIQYSDEGQSVNEDHRFQDYMNFANIQFNEFDTKITNAKSLVNESIGFGEVDNAILFISFL